MDRASFRALLAPAGQALLARVAALPDLREETLLRHLTRLRRDTPADLAAAAAETVLLRRRAAVKFARAERMYFTRDALEQATAEVIARHRAARFAGYDRVADLGCGIGGDSLALAAVSEEVVALDRDPLRLALARANAAAYGVAERVAWVQAELTPAPPVRVAAAFVDPARRTAGGRRVSRVEQYEPPLSLVRGWLPALPALAVKASPAIARADRERLAPEAEVEFISVAGELREAVLWFGPLRTAARRATLLPVGQTLTGSGPDQPLAIAAPGRYLLEPDPAVYRAELLGALAASLGAWQIDATIAYLSSDERPASPFVRSWAIEDVLPFSAKGVRQHLRARRVGSIVVKKRGSPIDPETFQRLLKLDGPEERTVVLTRVRSRPVAIICR